MGTALIFVDTDVPDSPLDALADEFGQGLIQRLSETMGGQSVRIPKAVQYLTDDHPLVAAVGRMDAEDIVGLCGGESIYIPSGGYKTRLPDQIKTLCAQGLTENQIAARLRITDRQVRRYKKRMGISTKENSHRSGRTRATISPGQRCIAFAREGMSHAEIAQRLQRTMQDVAFFLNHNEWPDAARKRAAH